MFFVTLLLENDCYRKPCIVHVMIYTCSQDSCFVCCRNLFYFGVLACLGFLFPFLFVNVVCINSFLISPLFVRSCLAVSFVSLGSSLDVARCVFLQFYFCSLIKMHLNLLSEILLLHVTEDLTKNMGLAFFKGFSSGKPRVETQELCFYS